MPLAGIVSVQNGASHGCAATSDGSARCWQTNTSAGNSQGQLGNGTTSPSAVGFRATQVLTAPDTPLTNVASMANGVSNNACAVTNDGSVYCWGDLTWIVNNGKSLLSGYAQAITTDGTTPLTGVSQVALGPNMACALVQGTASNTVWCWGYNAAGELGQGDTKARQYPTQVLGFSNPTWLVTAQNANDATVCAQDGDAVRCWGSNSSGSAGVNSATNPIQGPTLVVTAGGTSVDTVVDVEPGNSDFSILKSDGTMWNWGIGFTGAAANYGVTNIVSIGWAGGYGGGGPRYVTSDGIYHSAMGAITVNCGAL